MINRGRKIFEEKKLLPPLRHQGESPLELVLEGVTSQNADTAHHINDWRDRLQRSSLPYKSITTYCEVTLMEVKNTNLGDDGELEVFVAASLLSSLSRKSSELSQPLRRLTALIVSACYDQHTKILAKAELAVLRAERERRKEIPKTFLLSLLRRASRKVMSIVFFQWREEVHRCTRRRKLCHTRLSILKKNRAIHALDSHFRAWKKYTQTEGVRKRVLNYEETRDELIQRLARRVKQQERLLLSRQNVIDRLFVEREMIRSDLTALQRLVHSSSADMIPQSMTDLNRQCLGGILSEKNDKTFLALPHREKDLHQSDKEYNLPSNENERLSETKQVSHFDALDWVFERISFDFASSRHERRPQNFMADFRDGYFISRLLCSLIGCQAVLDEFENANPRDFVALTNKYLKLLPIIPKTKISSLVGKDVARLLFELYGLYSDVPHRICEEESSEKALNTTSSSSTLDASLSSIFEPRITESELSRMYDDFSPE